MKLSKVNFAMVCCIALMELVGCESVRSMIDSQTALGLDASAETATTRLTRTTDLENVLKNGRNEKARIIAAEKCNNVALFKRIVSNEKESSAVRIAAFQRLVDLGVIDRMLAEDQEFALLIVTGGFNGGSDELIMKRKFSTVNSHKVGSSGSVPTRKDVLFPEEYRIKAVENIKDSFVLPMVVMDDHIPLNVRLNAIKKARLSRQEFVNLVRNISDNNPKKGDYIRLVKAYIEAGDLVNKGINGIICDCNSPSALSFSLRKKLFSYLNDEEVVLCVLETAMQEISETKMTEEQNSSEVEFAKYLISSTKQEFLGKLILRGYKWQYPSFLIEAVNKITDDELLIKISKRDTGGYNDSLGLVCLAAAKRIKDESKKIFVEVAVAKYDPDIKKRCEAIARIFMIDPKEAYSVVSFHGIDEKDETVATICDEKTIIGLFEMNKKDDSHYQDDILVHLKKAAYKILKAKVNALQKGELDSRVYSAISQAKKLKLKGNACVIDAYYVGLPLEDFIALNKTQDVKSIPIDWALNEKKIFVITEMAFDTKNIYKVTDIEKSELKFNLPEKLGIADFDLEITDIKYNRNYIAEAFGSYDFNTVSGGEIYYRSENQSKGVIVTMWEKSGRVFFRAIAEN